jgi:porin
MSLSAALFTTNAWAEDIWARDKLTGDWGGGRTTLSDHGVDIGLRLSQYYQGVTSGGVDTNSEYGGTMDYRFNFDWKKLFGAGDGFSVSMHARTRFGNDIEHDAGSLTLPNTGMLMPLPGDYHGTDITGLTINQLMPVGEKHIGLFTLGKLDILDAVTMFFPSVGYGQEGFWNVNALVSALPWFGAVNGLSLYGGWFATINKENQTGQSAILATGTQNVTTNWGSISDSFDDGVWIAGFHRFFFDIDDKPGYFMIFGGFSTREQASNDPHDHIVIPGEGIESTDQKKPWNIALYYSQLLWQEEGNSDRKVTLLTGGTLYEDNPQFSQYNFFASVEAFGPFKSRPHDRMGVSGWYNTLSDPYKDLVFPVHDLQDLWGFELYYSFALNKWLHLTPDLQVLQGGHKDNDVALVAGVRLVIDF